MSSPAMMRRKKNVKKGIQFCLMVCGASGTGRTTFVNTLCGKSVLNHKDSDDPNDAHVEEGVKIKPVTVELELDEEGTRISLTIVDTPGFGDLIDNEASFAEIVGYLERQYDDILAEESRIKRNPRFRDNRVHAMLYFITPTGHEKLSKSVEGGAGVDSSMNPEDLASQSVRLKEEQLRREEEKLREIESKVQREIAEKRQELLARESQLREIEARMQREASAAASVPTQETNPGANGDHN
ncbi:septin [Verticillium alfalfae VaMs.102]|uniref:Septin n=1 Tax=Verticillium alfalfae (strain VaMs.102 / ATCC MYA-4576 / FGSC 10136) TaxID=526221 RepID=C9S9W7_VERA1|nr:septin [Verticillium alfalfae VaMs.102]EEY16180.1 septin [Verticillium alfalfae VaMs.102]